jgi:hypothetical protein
MGFQKINMRSRPEKVDLFWVSFSDSCGIKLALEGDFYGYL